MTKKRQITIFVTVQEEISKIFPKIGRAVRAVKRDLKDLKTPAGVVRVAFRNVRRAGRAMISTLRRIGSALGRLRRALLSVRSVVGVLFAAFIVGRGIRALLKTIAELDNLAKTADKLSIIPERLAELRFAAEQSGVSVASLDKSLKLMLKNLGDADTFAGEFAETFEFLGLNVSELSELAPEQIFARIATAIQKVNKASERTIVVSDIFGRSGADLLNLLKLSTTELEALARQARALGLTLDRDQLRIAEKLNDAVNRLRRAWQGLKQTLAISVAPVLTNLIDDLTVLVIVLPKLIDNLAKQLQDSFSEGAEGREARGQIAAGIRSLFAFITDLVVESVRVLVFAFVQALIVAFKAFAPQLEALGADLLFRISQGSLGEPMVYTEERKKQLTMELAELRADLAAELEKLELAGQAPTGAFFPRFRGARRVETLRREIALIVKELGAFGDATQDAEKSRRAFEAELALTADVMTQAFASAGDEIKESGVGLLDALKALVDFDAAADPKLVEDIKGQIASVRAELGELEDFDTGQAESIEGAVASLEKLIDLREAQAAGDERRAAILQQEIRHTTELVQLRNNLTKSGQAQGEQAQSLIDRLTELQITERRSLEIRLAAQEQLDRVLEAERKLREAIEDRRRGVELGLVTQQAATAATDAQAEALRVLAAAARNTIAALGSGAELTEFLRQIDRVVAGLRDIAGETGGIFAGIRAGINDFITEASNQFRNFQQLTTDLLGTIRSGFAGVFSGVIRGTQDLGQAFEDMLFRMLDRVIVFLTDQVILQFLQLFTAEGVLGAALQQFTSAIGVGGVGQAVTGGAAAGVAAISGVAEEGVEAIEEGANVVALTANTTALGLTTTALGALGTAIGTAVGAVGGIATGLGTTVGGAATVLEVAAAAVFKAVSANTLAVILNTKALAVETFTPLLAAGGLVPGPRVAADIVPARLTPGEWVLRQRAASYYGQGILEAMNRQLIPRELFQRFRSNVAMAAPVSMFQAGGSVQPTATPAGGLVPAVVVADDGTMDRLLAGGENALLRFFEDHAPRISALLARHRGLPT